jgi:alkylhydroperoxidase family enzyme
MIDTAVQTGIAQSDTTKANVADPHAGGPYLAPVERPSNPLIKLAYLFTQRQFGKVMGPLAVFSARMPWAFTAHSMKVSSLDKKLTLPRDTAIIIRERVSSLNGCLFCQDASRYYALQKGLQAKDKLDMLPDYDSSPLFNDAERAALDYASELTSSKHVSPETFARLRTFYSEREICEIAWLVASTSGTCLTSVWASAPMVSASSILQHRLDWDEPGEVGEYALALKCRQTSACEGDRAAHPGGPGHGPRGAARECVRGPESSGTAGRLARQSRQAVVPSHRRRFQRGVGRRLQ